MTLIASVLHLDRQAIKALKITSPYSLHRVVYSLFEDVRSEQEKQASKSSGLLYADQGGDYKSRKILLLSNRPPQEKVDGQYGEVQSKAISDSFLNHANYRFKVIVNPTKRDSASKKLLAVRGREAVHDWFAERAKTSWGFDVSPAQLQVDSINVLQFKDKNQRDITMAQASVQGTLQVTNQQQFINSFSQGVGRGRAFGCGLLQLVPLIENPFA
ncbi:type I-E CRISPR-associated protein Cas6/Cse3/CasE [Marinospirillum insulare]|uniref:Type I-E CRISPR-associated protein Cas6/Cse3/CasE n=1 Tax=Marinospirillum insulare TaxID=217169 RepID=A0ABQ5ZRK2_9GAMM|nr:type I-E CRISPR-associated protein Cas6/Cse3/CasE [Marinospirillum insulare]GLR62599.1 type I-E CRISPR-associated protein Cas6/Cse3/CasE [Marinospirillum insulare]